MFSVRTIDWYYSTYTAVIAAIWLTNQQKHHEIYTPKKEVQHELFEHRTLKSNQKVKTLLVESKQCFPNN